VFAARAGHREDFTLDILAFSLGLAVNSRYSSGVYALVRGNDIKVSDSGFFEIVYHEAARWRLVS
jgi:hypothetical protein